jgi:hypothetical protein
MIKRITQKQLNAQNAQKITNNNKRKKHRGNRGGCGGSKKSTNNSANNILKTNVSIFNKTSVMNNTKAVCSICKREGIAYRLIQSVLLNKLNSDCLHHITKFLGTDDKQYMNNKLADPYNKIRDKNPLCTFIDFASLGLYPRTMSYMGKQLHLDVQKQLPRYFPSRNRPIWCCNSDGCKAKYTEMATIQRAVINSPVKNLINQYMTFKGLISTIDTSLEPPILIKQQVHSISDDGYCGYVSGKSIAVAIKWSKSNNRFSTRNQEYIRNHFGLCEDILTEIFSNISVLGHTKSNNFLVYESLKNHVGKASDNRIVSKWIRKNITTILPFGNTPVCFNNDVSTLPLSNDESLLIADNKFTYYTKYCPHCNLYGRIQNRQIDSWDLDE